MATYQQHQRFLADARADITYHVSLAQDAFETAEQARAGSFKLAPLDTVVSTWRTVYDVASRYPNVYDLLAYAVEREMSTRGEEKAVWIAAREIVRQALNRLDLVDLATERRAQEAGRMHTPPAPDTRAAQTTFTFYCHMCGFVGEQQCELVPINTCPQWGSTQIAQYLHT